MLNIQTLVPLLLTVIPAQATDNPAGQFFAEILGQLDRIGVDVAYMATDIENNIKGYVDDVVLRAEQNVLGKLEETRRAILGEFYEGGPDETGGKTYVTSTVETPAERTTIPTTSTTTTTTPTTSTTTPSTTTTTTKKPLTYEEKGIRLIGSGNSGRIEIYYGGTWGTLCRSFMNPLSYDFAHKKRYISRVACNQLGLPHNNAQVIDSGFPTGNMYAIPTLKFSDIYCFGAEAKLQDCQMSYLGRNQPPCGNSLDIGVLCQ